MAGQLRRLKEAPEELISLVRDMPRASELHFHLTQPYRASGDI